MSSLENIVDAGICDLSKALSSGALTSVDLVAKCLLRIATYDCRNTMLNSIPLISENVFEEAVAADDRRSNGQAIGPLDGIPFTVKDSYKIKGLTVAAGADAFEELTANEDAFQVKALRDAGAVLLGQTNMCPMAYGGMLRGVYGRAESPYNLDYLAAAFGSGSSNGSGVCVAASFAAFGLGGETVSSGRSPASNNALVCYTPSKGLVSVRGSWPLYPTCDVVISHTRTMDDLLLLLDTVADEDPDTTGDFWRDQPFVSVPIPWSNRPKTFTDVKDAGFLQGKRIAVPRMYITQSETGPYISRAVTSLWNQARTELESAGAVVDIVEEFPAVEAYERQLLKNETPDASLPRLPDDWNSVERGVLIANAWEDFLKHTKDPAFPSLTDIDYTKMFPQFPRSNPQVKYVEPANAVHWPKLASYIQDRPATSTIYPGKSPIYDVPNLKEAVIALEEMRKIHLEAWMDTHGYDFVAFPAAGDVAKADADVVDESAAHAWTDGVKYSHGNRAIRHLGIPTVTVPMGLLEPSGMPMGLTFAGRAYDDVSILKVAYACEQKLQKRVVPSLTPVLPTDAITKREGISRPRPRPQLKIEVCTAIARESGKTSVSIKGTISSSHGSQESDGTMEPILDIYIDGHRVGRDGFQISTPAQSDSGQLVSSFDCEFVTPSPPPQDSRNKVVGKIARDSTMVMILARNGAEGQPAGYLKLIHTSDQGHSK